MRNALPVMPSVLGVVLRPLPLFPLARALQALTRRIAVRHPEILARLGGYADRRILLDVSDGPVALLLHPQSLRITVHRRAALPAHDVRLCGPLSAFLAMVHAAEDGDALFFSRDLTIEGDTEAALALRNAIDDAEIDLTEELAVIGGPFAPALRRAMAGAERATGMVLHRVDGTGAGA